MGAGSWGLGLGFWVLVPGRLVASGSYVKRGVTASLPFRNSIQNAASRPETNAQDPTPNAPASAPGAGDHAAREVILHRQAEQDEQPEESRGGDDPREARAPADVHEE